MRFFRDNGLTIVLVMLTVGSLLGMFFAGWSVHNDELSQHAAATVGLTEYIASGHFLSAVFENWESEFLQMSAYVVLTAFLFQWGSAESRDPDKTDVEAEHESVTTSSSRHRLRNSLQRTGQAIYAYSLGIALFSFFVVSFAIHLRYSADAANAQAILRGEEVRTLSQHLTSAEFWFESLQNWQSEFLSTAVIVVLSIFLRFRGSPESKPVSAENGNTGH